LTNTGARYCARARATAAPLPPVVNLMVGRSGDGLHLDWSPACELTVPDYAVYEGLLGDWHSHGPVLCSTGGAPSADIGASPGSHYYLVVARDELHEGSYGTDSDGTERASDAAPCAEQQSPGGCPPYNRGECRFDHHPLPA